ncbi:DUF4252 domain-containing protein [Prolixibacteraceae bacterium]|nr:DUF4252 domain-containing protein [Prolixibacteraceae bacterium]
MMKNKMIVRFFLLMLLVIPVTTYAKSGISIFQDKCSSIDGIKSFSFSGGWFDCSKFVSDVDISSIAEQTDNVSVMISSEDSDKVLKVWGNIRRDLNFEKMMVVNSDDDANISFWAKMKSRNEIEEIVLIVADKKSLVTVGLEGSYTMKQIKELSKNAKMSVK